MSLLEPIIIISFDIIIIALAFKTKIYTKILNIIKKNMPHIIMAFILFIPLCSFILLIIIYNVICTESTNAVALQTTNRYNILKEFVINSPIFFLVLCFIKAFFCLNDEEEVVEIFKKLQTSLLRMKISIMANNITVFLSIIFFFIAISNNIDILNLKFARYIQNYSFTNVNIYSEDTIRIALIIIFGILYYIGIFLVSNNFVGEVIDYNNEINKNNKQKRWKYKLLIYLLFINIYIMYLLNKEINNENRNNGT
jgi:hypothetical protein